MEAGTDRRPPTWLGRLEVARDLVDEEPEEIAFSPDQRSAKLDRERRLRVRAERRAEYLASLVVTERNARLAAEKRARGLQMELQAARVATLESMQRLKRTGRRKRRPSLHRRLR